MYYEQKEHLKTSVQSHSFHNRQLFTQENLTTSDVSMAPSLGVLSSRSKAEVDPYIYSSPMDTVTGLEMVKALASLDQFPVVCRFTEEWKDCFHWWLDADMPSNVWFAISAKKNCEILDYIAAHSKSVRGVNLSVDVAHGDSLIAHEATLRASQLPYVSRVMSGTVCTPTGALRAVQAGSTDIRVGVGPGSVCTTRLMTGFGLPNLSAVYRINNEISRYFEDNWGLPGLSNRSDIKIIADGGIKTPGDAVKYIVAGADGVMLGSALSKTYESSGWSKHWNKFGQLTSVTKKYRGQASASFQKELLGKTPKCAEGTTTGDIVPEESVEDVLGRYIGGMQSAISYAGVKSIHDMNTINVKFERITASGWVEGTPHGAR
jgi:IMP dehydrogenase/GMP reductase